MNDKLSKAAALATASAAASAIGYTVLTSQQQTNPCDPIGNSTSCRGGLVCTTATGKQGTCVTGPAPCHCEDVTSQTSKTQAPVVSE